MHFYECFGADGSSFPSFWGYLTCLGESEPGYPLCEFGLMLKRCWHFVPLCFWLCCVPCAFSGGPHCVAEERGVLRGFPERVCWPSWGRAEHFQVFLMLSLSSPGWKCGPAQTLRYPLGFLLHTGGFTPLAVHKYFWEQLLL